MLARKGDEVSRVGELPFPAVEETRRECARSAGRLAGEDGDTTRWAECVSAFLSILSIGTDAARCGEIVVLSPKTVLGSHDVSSLGVSTMEAS